MIQKFKLSIILLGAVGVIPLMLVTGTVVKADLVIPVEKAWIIREADQVSHLLREWQVVTVTGEANVDAATKEGDTPEITVTTIMVTIPEYHITRQIPDPAGETEIIRQLVEAGFTVVDQKQIDEIRYREEVKAALEGDSEKLVELSQQFNADVIIVGEAFSEFVGTYQGLVSCRARLEAKAITTEEGIIIAAHGVEASALDVSENVASKRALAEAGRNMANYLIEMLSNLTSAEITLIEVSIIGLRNYAQFDELKRAIENLSKVVKVTVHSFEDGKAELDVSTLGDSWQLVDNIRDFTFIRLEITKVTEQSIDISVSR